MSSVSQRFKTFQKDRKSEQNEHDLAAVQAMTYEELCLEKIAFGKSKVGMSFEEAFADGGWTDWFISNYEHSPKVSHQKFIRYVELRLDAEIQAETQPVSSTAAPKAAPKMTAAKSKAAAVAKGRIQPPAEPSERSWTPVEIESEEETAQFAILHLEEEVCFMRQENRQLNQRPSGLEGALQEVITHLKKSTVKEEQ